MPTGGFDLSPAIAGRIVRWRIKVKNYFTS